jgi:hypothetical protein
MIDKDNVNIYELSDDDIRRIKKYKNKQSSLIIRVARNIKRNFYRSGLAIRWYVNTQTQRYLPSKTVQKENTSRNLHIFYRHVHLSLDHPERLTIKNRPAWFSHEKCFFNLISTIQSSKFVGRVKVVIIFDGLPEELREDFIAKFSSNINPVVEIKIISSTSALEAFMIMLGIVKNSDILEDDIIYLLENDYLHQQGWVDKVFSLFESDLKFDIASLYDHPDLYNLKKHANSSYRLLHSLSHHWRVAPSTCASFLLTKKSFDRDLDVFRLCIPDYQIFSKLVNQRGRVLLVSVPALSTHCMPKYLAPCVDWEKINSDAGCS